MQRTWVARLVGRVNHVTDHSIEAIRESIARGGKPKVPKTVGKGRWGRIRAS